jgi:hypothetical protein
MRARAADDRLGPGRGGRRGREAGGGRALKRATSHASSYQLSDHDTTHGASS